MSIQSALEVVIRPASPVDSAICGRICYEAFEKINGAHGFPCDFPSPEAAKGLLAMMFSSPSFHCVVAEVDGCIVGSNCLDERSVIAGVGPITVDPRAQNLNVGRKLMEAVMKRARERGAEGVRLVQAAFHNRSLSLYTKLGFDILEPLACLQGRTTVQSVAGCTVRPAEHGDIELCEGLSMRVHGFHRGVELQQAIEHKTAKVVERDGRITGYSSALAFFGHATAETNLDMQALMASADGFEGPGILVPTRNSGLLRWCLENGLRVVQPMNLMSTGFHREPAGTWTASVLF